MGKIKIGSINHQAIVKGDINLLNQGEILINDSEDYTVIRKKTAEGKIKTFVVIPLEEFKVINSEVTKESVESKEFKRDRKRSEKYK